MQATLGVASRATAARQVAPFRASKATRLVCSCVAKPPRAAVDSSISQKVLPATFLGLSGLLTPFLLEVNSALATSGEYGLLEGRSAALIHPITMASLFGASVYAGYLGWQWRRTRTLPDEIKTLKKQLPAAPEGEPRPPSELDGQIKALEAERKSLLAGNFRDKHWQWSSIILAAGVGIGIEGAANTFIRTGKLFPGPHLFAGAFIVAIWALAASLVPQMQKGNDTARNAHIALNVLNTALFAWQLPTGWEIVLKVFQFTSWP